MKNIQNKLELIYGDVNLGIKGHDFHCIFSYQRSGLESLVVSGKEWLYREPQPAYWRATTDNDRGYKFSKGSAVWLGADMFPNCIDRIIKIDGKKIIFPKSPINNRYSNLELAELVEVIYIFETNTVPSTKVSISYTVNLSGQIIIKSNYKGQKNLPDLPVFGLRFIIPTKAKKFEYKGLSGETYPDRLDGGKEGIFKIEGLPVTPYLVPQDCGVHMNTEWLKITRNTVLNVNDKSRDDFSLLFKKVDGNFAFSCLPYTPFELENAYHQEELPIARRTILTIYGEIRGIGGIDSWQSGIEKQYEISAADDYEFSFAINIDKDKSERYI